METHSHTPLKKESNKILICFFLRIFFLFCFFCFRFSFQKLKSKTNNYITRENGLPGKAKNLSITSSSEIVFPSPFS